MGGALISKATPGGPMFPGLLGDAWVSADVQLVDAGDRLVAVVSRAGRLPGEQDVAESFVYLIDPKTSRAQLAWKGGEAGAGPR